MDCTYYDTDTTCGYYNDASTSTATDDCTYYTTTTYYNKEDEVVIVEKPKLGGFLVAIPSKVHLPGFNYAVPRPDV